MFVIQLFPVRLIHFLFMIGLKHLLKYKIKVQQFLIYIILGFAFVNNGVIIYWGYAEGLTTSIRTITIPITLTTDNYIAIAIRQWRLLSTDPRVFSLNIGKITVSTIQILCSIAGSHEGYYVGIGY